jgi:hypothetical protein
MLWAPNAVTNPAAYSGSSPLPAAVVGSPEDSPLIRASARRNGHDDPSARPA